MKLRGRVERIQFAIHLFPVFCYQVKLVNIRNDDITDGNPKLTLGLIWTIILHFQVGVFTSLFVILQEPSREDGN